MSETTTDDVIELQKFFNHFSKELNEKLNEIEKLAHEVYQNITSVVEIEKKVHKLSGSCETFGYELLGKKAREFEQFLGETKLNPTPMKLDQIKLHVTILHNIFMQTSQEEAYKTFLKKNTP